MPNEAKWMRQLSAGDSTAWARLIDQWSPRLYHYITANGVGEVEAQTLLHRSFSQVVQSVVGSPPSDNLTIFIWTIAYRQMLSYCQQCMTSSLRQLPPKLSPKVGVDPQSPHLLQKLHQCSPEIQQVALLYYLCEVSVADIAQIVGQPEAVIESALYRVKRQLVP